MKAYTCGVRAAFIDPPEKCALYQNGNCADLRPCNAAEMVIIPRADYDAQQAAIAAAIGAITDYMRIGHGRLVFQNLEKALAQLRAVKGT